MKINLRLANLADLDLYYRWARDPEVRKQSFNQNEISFEEHSTWYKSKLNDKETTLYVFENESAEVVGQLRFQLNNEEYVAGLNVDPDHRSMGYAREIVRMGSDEFMKNDPQLPIVAYIKKTNKPSFNSFKNAGYIVVNEMCIYDVLVNKMILINKTS